MRDLHIAINVFKYGLNLLPSGVYYSNFYGEYVLLYGVLRYFLLPGGRQIPLVAVPDERCVNPLWWR